MRKIKRIFSHAIDYQRQLIFASLEDFTPNAALPNLWGGQYGTNPSAWKDAVSDFICRNIEAGLLDVVEYPGKPAAQGGDQIKNLLENGDEARGLDELVIWDAIFFTGTLRLEGLLQEFDLLSWESLNAAENEELIDFLSHAYERVRGFQG